MPVTYGVRDSGIEFMSTTHELGTGRGATLSDMEIGEAQAVSGKAVNVGCLDDLVARHPKFPLSHIVGKNNYDIRLVGLAPIDE